MVREKEQNKREKERKARMIRKKEEKTGLNSKEKEENIREKKRRKDVELDNNENETKRKT
jgi:hypothetical protein